MKRCRGGEGNKENRKRKKKTSDLHKKTEVSEEEESEELMGGKKGRREIKRWKEKESKTNECMKLFKSSLLQKVKL